MSKSTQLLLAAARTDSTFERMTLDGRSTWVGKCIHCNAKLVLDERGNPLGPATLEHIIPQTRGGTDDLHNLAVACASCNHEKGRRHDHKRGKRPEEVIATLQARRADRWRDPA
ncbi:MAG: HNH endonuclease [Kofleriaceae bacterium]